MRYDVFAGGSELLEKLESVSTRHPNQKDDRDYRFFFSQGISLSTHHDESSVHVMVDYIVEQTKDYKPAQASHLNEYKRHIIIIILNLAKCVFNRQWCKIPLRNNAFGKGNQYNRLSYRHFKRAIDTLERIGFIELIKGANYSKGASRSVMQPKSVMSGRAIYAYLESFDVKSEYVAVTGLSANLSDRDERQMKIDRRDMRLINDFLESHHWAAKSSIQRIYSKEVGRAGRLYCNYQRLPQRNIPIRQHCLIDGEPIVEVDIKSSHPRLAVAQVYKKKLPRDFYKAVADATGVYQGKVKHYFQNAFSCSSREVALSSFKKNEPYGDELNFNAVETYARKLYPDLPYYEGWSVWAMNIEGEILKQVMLDGVKEGVVALPVHDALAVQERHEAWARGRLTHHWNAIVGVDACELG
jgi:hypothetical protein